MTQTLERSVRSFVAEGSELQTKLVIPGNSPGNRPTSEYASLLLMHDVRRGYPIRKQLSNDLTADLVYRRATFSLQFYRRGAVDNAAKFDFWTQTENGLLQAETAFSDGRINHIRVLDSGEGYTSKPDIQIAGIGGGGVHVEANLLNERVVSIFVADGGSGYSQQPTVTLSGGGGSGATATAQGSGFRVVFPLTIIRLDNIVGDKFEERAQIDLGIDYFTSEGSKYGWN